MKRLADPRGERVWYDAAEIERITADALRSGGLMPCGEMLAVDIESLIEVHLGAVVDYAGDLPDLVLGYTEFTQPPRIVVSRRLTDLASAPGSSLGLRGRWRATLAHEAAHILLHAHIRGVGSVTPKLTAHSISAATEATPSDWREVQANMGMAALLMPRGAFLEEARRLLEREAVFLPIDADGLRARRLVEVLAERFETSHEATGLRLLALGWTARADPRSRP